MADEKTPQQLERDEARDNARKARELSQQAVDSLMEWFNEPGDAPTDMPNPKDLKKISNEQFDEEEDKFNQETGTQCLNEMDELLLKAIRNQGGKS